MQVSVRVACEKFKSMAITYVGTLLTLSRQLRHIDRDCKFDYGKNIVGYEVEISINIRKNGTLNLKRLLLDLEK